MVASVAAMVEEVEEGGGEEAAEAVQEVVVGEEVVGVVAEKEANHLHADFRRVHKDASELTVRFSTLPAHTIQGHPKELMEHKNLKELPGNSHNNHSSHLSNHSNLSGSNNPCSRRNNHSNLELNPELNQVVLEEKSHVSLATDADNLLPELVHLIIPTRQLLNQIKEPSNNNFRINNHMVCPMAIQMQVPLPKGIQECSNRTSQILSRQEEEDKGALAISSRKGTAAWSNASSITFSVLKEKPYSIRPKQIRSETIFPQGQLQVVFS